MLVLVLEEVEMGVRAWPSSLLLGLEVNPKGQPLLREEGREEAAAGVDENEASRAEGGMDEEGDEEEEDEEEDEDDEAGKRRLWRKEGRNSMAGWGAQGACGARVDSGMVGGKGVEMKRGRRPGGG